VEHAEQPGDRDLVDLGLLSNIYEIWTTSGCTYGSDRVWRQLRRDGISVGRKRVERLMRAQGWQGAFVRRGWRRNSTVHDPNATPAPDLVNRQFTARAPNRLWVADATRIPCGEGAFWLAAVRDAFSNRIVGWRCSDRCDTDLILGALEYGIWSRDIRDGQLVHHSDKGSNGGFNWSSQHPDHGGVRGAAEGLDDEGHGRPAMNSPGRPPAWRREQRQGFWDLIAQGVSSEQAALSVGVSQPVGSRWFREAGGMPDVRTEPLTGRFLSIEEREEIGRHVPRFSKRSTVEHAVISRGSYR
jgi:putative transposase